MTRRDSVHSIPKILFIKNSSAASTGCTVHDRIETDIMTRIADLEYGCAGLPIEIRILRKWTPHFRNKETWFIATDEHGDAIAIMGEQQGQQFVESNFQINKCYVVEQYTCTETAKHQRTIRNKVHLNVGQASKITPLHDVEKIPSTYFDFVSVDQLQSFIDIPTYFPDFLGAYKKQTLYYKKNGDPFLLLTLIDATGKEITATIWKECMENAEKIDASALSALTTQTMIAITNMSSTDATHILINPPVHPHVTQHQQLTTADTQGPTVTPDTVKTLQEVASMSYEDMLQKTIIVDARITKTEIENSWYNVSCPDCKCQISRQRQIWFCPNHGQKSDPNFFYNVKIVLSDGTADLQGMATDACMQKIIGRTCKQIITEDAYEDRKTIPPAFRNEGMNTKRFYIELTKKSGPNNMNYIIVNTNPIPNQPSSPQTTTSTALPITETPQTTPPPHTPTTPESDKKTEITNAGKTSKDSKPSTAKQLQFDLTDETDNEADKDARKRKPANVTEDIEILNPGKRERFPE